MWRVSPEFLRQLWALKLMFEQKRAHASLATTSIQHQKRIELEYIDRNSANDVPLHHPHHSISYSEPTTTDFMSQNASNNTSGSACYLQVLQDPSCGANTTQLSIRDPFSNFRSSAITKSSLLGPQLQESLPHIQLRAWG